jgi:MEDS: MEthanogen/methylotroph, DcmR Sensory domain
VTRQNYARIRAGLLVTGPRSMVGVTDIAGEEVKLSRRSTMRGNESSIHVANGVLGHQCHICAFFNGFDEQHRVLRTFIKEGFERGDRAFHIVDPGLRDAHLRRLAEAGIDVDQAMATGQLELRRWQDAYLRDDRFDQDGMLALLEQVLGSGSAAGNPLIRFVSRVEPSLVEKAGEDNWLEYETRVNYAVSKYHDPVICTYDLANFSASLVMDMLRVHPVVIVGGILQENPFFVPPDQFLIELRERKSVRSSAIHADRS